MFGIIVSVFDPYTYSLMKNTFSRGTKLLVILGRHGVPNCSMFCFVLSYVLTGTEKGMNQTFGTTCHGAGRALSRSKSRRNIDYQEVLDSLKSKGISIRVASPKLVMEEAPESYKNVTDVINTCHDAGISQKAIKLRPIAVIKG